MGSRIDDINLVLSAYGLPTLASIDWVALAIGFVFSIIGMVVFAYGQKRKLQRTRIIGILLMVYPYFVPGAVLSFLVGAGLCAVLYFWKE